MHRLFVRTELRRHWPACLGLAVVVAIVVAAVVATLSGARRSERVFHDLRSVTQSADIKLAPPEGTSLAEMKREIKGLAGVGRVSTEAELFLRPVGTDLFPDFNLYARAPIRARDAGRVNVPVIVKGRAVDPHRVDEVNLSENLAHELGVSVGDVVAFESMTEQWVNVAYNGGDAGPPDGPVVKARVVGLARTPADFGRWSGIAHFSPAFVRRYSDEMQTFRFAEVQMPSAADRQRLERQSNDVEGGLSIFADDTATDDGLATIATALRLVALVAALAGAVVVGLALTRLTRLILQERPTLVALGSTRRQVVGASVSVLGPWLGLGLVSGAALGVVVAPRALVGLAGKVDPTLGAVRVDSLVVLAVVVFTLVFGLLVVVLTARRSLPAELRGTRRPTRILRLDHPLPVVLGVRQAVAGEARLGGRSSRAAIAVLSIGIAGAIAALVVSASIDRLQTDPHLTGQGTGRIVDSGESIDAYDAVLPLLRDDRRVASLAGVHVGFGVHARGVSVPLLAYDRIRGSLGASVVSGGVAQGRDEVALGPATLDALGKNVGDHVRLRSDQHSATYRIVGSVLFPEGDFSYDEGAALTAAGAARVLGDVRENVGLHQVLFDWKPGVNVAAAERDLKRAGFEVLTNDNALKPARVINLGEVDTLPRYLAGLLGVLALVTFGYALSLSTRRRRHEAATLRALGFTARSGAAVVGAQSLTIVATAVVIGVPVGLLLGSRIWTFIAENANVLVLVVAPTVAIVAFLSVMIVVAGVLTAFPAWSTWRLRAGDALRAE